MTSLLSNCEGNSNGAINYANKVISYYDTVRVKSLKNDLKHADALNPNIPHPLGRGNSLIFGDQRKMGVAFIK